jgi:hypothetical protein
VAGGGPVHVFPPFRFSNGTTRQNFAGVLKIKGQSILTGYKSPRAWNEPCAWHEINLAHKFPVKTNVPEPRRKLRRPKKQGAFICLPPVRWLLALHTMPPGAWLLLFIYQWCVTHFESIFWKGIISQNLAGLWFCHNLPASLNIASLSLPEWVTIWDRYTVNCFHYKWKNKRKCNQWNQWMTIRLRFVSKGYNKFHVHAFLFRDSSFLILYL